MGGKQNELGPDVVARLLARDASAYARLVDCYERPLFKVAFRMLGNAAEAAEVTQDTFLKVFENMPAYDPRHRLFSWVYRIAVNTAIDRLKHRRHEALVAIAVDDLPLASEVPGPDEHLADSQRQDVVQAALMELQDDHRAVIVLRHFSGCSYGEMATILGIPEKTVKSRLYSARQLLKDRLCARGVTA